MADVTRTDDIASRSTPIKRSGEVTPGKKVTAKRNQLDTKERPAKKQQQSAKQKKLGKGKKKHIDVYV